MKRDLNFYIKAFEHLKRDYKKGGAPHKPILLLSLIDVFEQGILSGGSIPILPELIAFFKRNWSRYVITEHDLSFALPFYHLQSEPFWRLIPNEGCEVWLQSKGAMRSLGNLQAGVKYAQIDTELVECLLSKVDREVLRQVILHKYFPDSADSGYINDGLKLIEDIKKEIVEDSKVEYVARMKTLKASLDNVGFEEEVILRSSLFKREVPKNYNYTCCISGLQVSVSFNSATLIEACHIEPFSTSYNDTLSNGIALTPTLHKAFDRGIISISDDYLVIVSKKYSETASPQGIRQYDGRLILLPASQIHYPSVESLRMHREKIFER